LAASLLDRRQGALTRDVANAGWVKNDAMTTRTGPPFVRSSEAKRARRHFLESFSRPIAFRLDAEEAVARLENSAHIARRTSRRCTTLVDLDQRMPASDLKQ
jgi:hypothetical protein